MYKTTIKIDGMACGMCEAHVNEAIRKVCAAKKVTSSHKKGPVRGAFGTAAGGNGAPERGGGRRLPGACGQQRAVPEKGILSVWKIKTVGHDGFVKSLRSG